eukprot:gene4887-5132_t
MALTDLASSMKEQGIDVIGLAAGEPDFDTPDEVVEAGIEALLDNGLEYAPDEVVVSNGAKQSIWQGLLASVSPGDEVIIPAPYWVSYPEMVRLAGAVPVIVPTTPEQGFLMSPEQLQAVLTPKSRLLILCTPSNPTGKPVAAMVSAFEERRNYVVERLKQIPGVKLAEPQGAFYVLPDMSGFFGPGVEAKGYGPIPDADTLCMYLIQVAHVALVPGDAFGAPACVRISYAASMATLKEALDRLVKALQPEVFSRPAAGSS